MILCHALTLISISAVLLLIYMSCYKDPLKVVIYESDPTLSGCVPSKLYLRSSFPYDIHNQTQSQPNNNTLCQCCARGCKVLLLLELYSGRKRNVL